jgi:hypothetical protein
MFYNIAGSCGPGLHHCFLAWIEWKRLLGFTQFYLYDNGSTDNVVELLTPYIAAGIVTLVDWPCKLGGTDNNHGQRVQIQHVQLAFGDRVELMAFMDYDEFFRPTLWSEQAKQGAARERRDKKMGESRPERGKKEGNEEEFGGERIGVGSQGLPYIYVDGKRSANVPRHVYHWIVKTSIWISNA